MKKLLSKVMAILFIVSIFIAKPNTEVVEAATLNNNLDNMISSTIDGIQESKPNPEFGGQMEWLIIGMARSKNWVPSSYYEKYYKSVEEKVEKEFTKVEAFTPDYNNKDYTTISDAAKIVLALNAIGKDARDVAGHDLVQLILDRKGLGDGGVYELLYSLLALDSNDYSETQGTVNTRATIVDKLLAQKTALGGFGYEYGGEQVTDIDTTAMAIQALAKHNNREDVKKVLASSLNILKSKEIATGGYHDDWGTGINPCTTAQAEVALVALGNNSVANFESALAPFYEEGNGFKFSLDSPVDDITTAQVLYSLVAYERSNEGKNFVFNMADVTSKAKTVADNIVSTDIFKNIKTNNSEIIIGGATTEGKKYSMTFKGSDITDTTIDFNKNISLDSKNNDKINTLADNAFIINFEHSGNLPGKASVSMQVDLADGEYKLFYFDETTQKSVEQESKVIVKGGVALFTISHCSDYFIAKELKTATTPVNTITDVTADVTTDATINLVSDVNGVKTGDSANIGYLVVFMIICGTVAFRARKKEVA